MGWQSEVAPHDGWVANVLADGRTASTTDAHGVIIWGPTIGSGEEHVPWDQVVAWRVMCECGWTGPSVPAYTDAEYGFRSCPEEIEDGVMLTAWNEHLAPFEAVLELGTVSAELSRLTQRAEELVTVARAAGVAWSEIGAAAGVSRQGAQQRWGHLVESRVKS